MTAPATPNSLHQALTPRPWRFASLSGLVMGIVLCTAFLVETTTATLDANGAHIGGWPLGFLYAATTLGPPALAIFIAVGILASIPPSLLYPILRRAPHRAGLIVFALLFAVTPGIGLAWASTYPSPFWVVAAALLAVTVVVIALTARPLFPVVRSSR